MQQSQHEIEGYRMCDCGALVLNATADMQSGRCADCFADVNAAMTVIEIMHRGQRTNLPGRVVRSRQASKGNKQTMWTVRKAKLAAMRRLRMLYPAMYDMLYDEERAALGLTPISRPGQKAHLEAAQTYEFAQVYAALTETEDVAL
jgi:hypothetical protein